jgi:hypothetical protein
VQRNGAKRGFDVTSGDVKRLSGRAPRSFDDVIRQPKLWNTRRNLPFLSPKFIA